MDKKLGGYENLIVYKLSVVIYDSVIIFCKKYLQDTHKSLPTRRTIEQMIQAARSGKQNIVEGSLEKSLKLNIKLTGVSRASLGELLEDFKDFLRTNNFSLWDKDDPRVKELRRIRDWSNETNLTNWTNNPERFANLLITLLHLENYLLDQMIRSLENKFITQGGYSENLFKKRLDQRSKD